MLVRAFGKSLVSALNNSLRTDINPGSGCHLAIHGQTFFFQVPEHFPITPAGYQVGVGDQDTGRFIMGAKNPNRFAALDQQGFVVFQSFERLDNSFITVPVAGCFTCPTIDN